MKVFSSKLALNQALLEKDKAIQSGEIVAVKTYSSITGDREIKYFLKKCATCGEIFFQSEKGKHVYINCDKCSKITKKKVFPNGYT